MVDNERKKVKSLDPCLKHRFLGCFAYNTFPVSGYREGRFAIVNTSPHYYTSGHWLLVACKQKLILYDSFGRGFTTFSPEMLNALKNGLCADHNRNIYQLIPSDSSKQTLQSSICAFYCIMTANFLYNYSLDSFPHCMTEEDEKQFVLSKYDLKYSQIKLYRDIF